MSRLSGYQCLKVIQTLLLLFHVMTNFPTTFRWIIIKLLTEYLKYILTQVELVENVSVDGRKQHFAERSSVMEVPLICPWSEEPSTSSLHLSLDCRLLILMMLILLPKMCYLT